MQQKQHRLVVLQRHSDRLRRHIFQYQKLDMRFSTLRLVVAGVGFGVSQLAWFFLDPLFVWATIAMAIAAFVLVIREHRKLQKLLRHSLIARDMVDEQIGRMTHDFSEMPIASDFDEPTPLEHDLDLIGNRSLHHLLDTSVTTGGSERLREWLNVGFADEATIQHRQQLIAELMPKRAFREQLTRNARTATRRGGNWSPDALLFWLEKQPTHNFTQIFPPLAALAIVNVGLFIAAQFGVLEGWWQATTVAYVIGLTMVGRQAERIFHQTGHLSEALEQLLKVFGLLENHSYREMPGVKALCGPFLNMKNRPNRYLKRIIRIFAGMGLVQGNPMLAILAHAIFPWGVWLTLLLEREKRNLKQHLPLWLDTWFELEALAALANFGWINPHFTFPEVSTRSTGSGQAETEAIIEGTALGHPLLPDNEKVCNDFSAETLGDLHILTGSNMAGKSTFLRTVGVNLVLAYAGSPVDAARFVARPARLFSCIHVSDSIADGFSYFYAEVRRLRDLLDQLNLDDDLPLIYFVDEIFRGTNNRERLIGSQAIVRSAAGGNGFGLISTHDLELVKLSAETDFIQNFHFRENVENGRMTFDYLLRPGPCPTTNALKIMRLAGLPVQLTNQT